jgi:hypothetical protein
MDIFKNKWLIYNFIINFQYPHIHVFFFRLRGKGYAEYLYFFSKFKFISVY